MIADLKIDPSDYSEEAYQFYRYFEKKRTSPEYVTKLLRILNAWGYYVCRRYEKPFLAIKNPRGKDKQDIARAYRKKEDARGPADPLTPSALEDAQSSLLDHNYRWLFLSVWLGLRSEEVDHLKDQTYWRVDARPDGIPVLRVFRRSRSGWGIRRLRRPGRGTRIETSYISTPCRERSRSLRFSANFCEILPALRHFLGFWVYTRGFGSLISL